MDTFAEQAEEQAELFRQRQQDTTRVFDTRGSSGSNNVKLARILTAFDFAIGLLGWKGKALADLTTFCTQYQASIDTRYHNDYKDIKVAEEIERKRAERKGISILSQ